MARLLGRVVHELLELLRREKVLELLIDGVHALHILRTSQTFLPNAGVLKVHTIDSVDTNRVLDAQLTYEPRGLLEGFLLGSTLQTLSGNRLLRHHKARQKGHYEKRE